MDILDVDFFGGWTLGLEQVSSRFEWEDWGVATVRRYTTQLRTECFSQTLLCSTFPVRELQHVLLDAEQLEPEEERMRSILGGWVCGL